MTTGLAKIFAKTKRLFGVSDVNELIVGYLESSIETLTKVTYPNQCTFGKIELDDDGANQFKLVFPSTNPDGLCTDGFGHTLKISDAEYFEGINFANSNGVEYHIGLRHCLVPSGGRINPRTGRLEYIGMKEEVGFAESPSYIGLVGGDDYIVEIDNHLLVPGDDYTGRVARVWLNDVSENASDFSEAVVDVICTETNGFLLSSLLGQVTMSTNVDDYIVAILGPDVTSDSSILNGVGTTIGTITGNAATPYQFDYVIQNVLGEGYTYKTRQVQTISDLKSLYGSHRDVTSILGHSSFMDGGEGTFVYDSSKSQGDDDGGIIIADAGTGCWIRQYEDQVNISSFGVFGDGTTDNTTLFQAALDGCEGKTLFVQKPASKYIIGQVDFPYNIKVIVEPGTVIEAAPGIGSTDSIFNIEQVANVCIIGFNSTIQGLGAGTYSGADNHGVRIAGSTDVEVYGFNIKDTGGDGLHISEGGAIRRSTDVTISDLNCTSNRATGITLVSGRNIKITDCYVTGSDGADPMAGVSIEPSSNSHNLENIYFENIYSNSNTKYGFRVKLAGIAGATDRKINVKVDNFTDVYSAESIYVDPIFLDGDTLDGQVEFNEFESFGPDRRAVLVNNYDVLAPRIIFNRPRARRVNNSQDGSAWNACAFVVFRTSSDSGAATIGNVTFNEAVVIDDRTTPYMYAGFYFRDFASTDSLEKVDLINPIQIDTGTDGGSGLLHFGAGILKDDNRVLVFDTPGAAHTITRYSVYSEFSNLNSAVSTVKFTLEAYFKPGAPRMRFLNNRIGGSYIIQIEGDAGSVIVPIGAVFGQYIECVGAGHSAVLERLNSTHWLAVASVGTWTRE